MDNLGRPVDVRHMDPASQGAHRFAKGRKRMVNLVEWIGIAFPSLTSLPLSIYPDRGKNGKS